MARIHVALCVPVHSCPPPHRAGRRESRVRARTTVWRSGDITRKDEVERLPAAVNIAGQPLVSLEAQWSPVPNYILQKSVEAG